MPLFEDDTLKGAIRKAVRAERPTAVGYSGSVIQYKQRAGSARRETFGDRAFGSTIGGSGSGFTTIRSAVNSVASEMERLARSTYPDRVDQILAGQRHRAVMIPELASAIYAQRQSNGNLVFGYDHLTVGSREVNGSGRFTISATSNLAAVVHAHWVDNRPSAGDRSIRIQVANQIRRSQHNLMQASDLEFYIYSLVGGLAAY
jgi:hypothetical protein